MSKYIDPQFVAEVHELLLLMREWKENKDVALLNAELAQHEKRTIRLEKAAALLTAVDATVVQASK